MSPLYLASKVTFAVGENVKLACRSGCPFASVPGVKDTVPGSGLLPELRKETVPVRAGPAVKESTNAVMVALSPGLIVCVPGLTETFGEANPICTVAPEEFALL